MNEQPCEVVASEDVYERAITAHQNGKYVEAKYWYDLLLSGFPAHPVLLEHKGILEFEHGHYAEGIACLKLVLEQTPDAPNALMNLGAIYLKTHRLDESIAALEHSLRLDPSQIKALSNLGEAYRKLERLDQAEHLLRRALELAEQTAFDDTKLRAIKFNLAIAMSNTSEAAKFALDVWRSEPSNVRFANLAVQHLASMCAWGELNQALAVTLSLRERAELLNNDSFIINQHYCEDFDARSLRSIAEAGCRYDYGYIDSNFFDPKSLGTKARLRIGYLLADARNHANGYNTMLVLTGHNRAQFEVFVYSTGPNDHDTVRKHIESGAEHFVDLHNQDNVTIARHIANDQIDILVDLMGHKAMNRLTVLAHRPAPVQMTWLGFPGTCGADFIDYIIGDPIVTPFELADEFSERIAQLPHCYQANNHRLYTLSPVPARKDIGLPEHVFVFCCLNNQNKITPKRFSLWMAILRACPSSVLWLYSSSDEARENLIDEAAKHGVDASRLVFSKPDQREAYLDKLQAADLFLDTAPYGAHTTASDALWAGVPVLTALGSTFASRVCASLVTAAGIPEMVMPDEAAYVEQAIRWYHDPASLRAIRSKLVAGKAQAPLFDSALLIRSLEELYTRAWQDYLSAQ